MAGAPAYRYDRMTSAQPARHAAPAPSVRVVPGRKHAVNPSISDNAVIAIKIAVALLIAFMVVGIVRIALSSFAYGMASSASDLRSEISDARTTGESLAVQESLLSSPSNIRQQAEERSMVPAASAESMTLSFDPVVIDGDGNLSFAGSVERLAQQG